MFKMVSVILFTGGGSALVGSAFRRRVCLQSGGLPLGEDTWYWHLVVATAAVGTHATGMHS